MPAVPSGAAVSVSAVDFGKWARSPGKRRRLPPGRDRGRRGSEQIPRSIASHAGSLLVAGIGTDRGMPAWARLGPPSGVRRAFPRDHLPRRCEMRLKRKKKNRSHFHLESLGCTSPPRSHHRVARQTNWAWNPPSRREPRSFKSKSVVSKAEPAIKPTMAVEWEILVAVPSASRPKPANASPTEARLRGVTRKSVHAWRAP